MSEKSKKFGLLVGMHFARPAGVLLQALRDGEELELVREPENHYDANAIQALVRTSALDFEELAKLQGELEDRGFTLESLREQENWLLGHLAAEGGKPALRAAKAGLDIVPCGVLAGREGELPLGRLRFVGEFVLVELGEAADATA